MITLNPLIFGTVITIANLKNKELNNKLLKFCKKLKKTSGRKISNVGGFQSNFVNQDDPLIKEFFDYTKQHILNYTYAYEIDGVIVTDDKLYSRKSGNPEHSLDLLL